MLEGDDLHVPGRIPDAVPGTAFPIPPCPLRRRQPVEKDVARTCDEEGCCRCARLVEQALRSAIRRVLGDIAAQSALGADKRTAVIAIARAEGAAFGCKSLSRTVHARWTSEHVAVHGELPSDRTMRRWYRESFEAHPTTRSARGQGSGGAVGGRGSPIGAGGRT